MFKENEANSTHAEPTKCFGRTPQSTSYPSKPHNYKRGKSPMISTDNMHQGYIFRVCSVVLLVVQCYRFCWCCSFVCLLTSYTFLRVSTCMLHFVAAVALCVLVRGAGATLNTVKRIVTLHWTQTNLIYITIHRKKVSIQMNLKISCTSCSDWQPSTMRVSIACFIALLLMLLLAKVKVDVFRVWPFSL